MAIQDEKIIMKELMKKKAEDFKSENEEIHVVLKTTRKFYRGNILSVTPDYFLLMEGKLQKRIKVYFDEIYKLEPREK